MSAILKVVAFLREEFSRARIRRAALLLLTDYKADGSLTEFSALDGEDSVDYPETMWPREA